MAMIYNNIAANAAPVVPHTITGCENQILFRANAWGTTQVQVESYSANDPTQKTFLEFSAGSNVDWCPQCVSVGEIYRFSVINPDPLTTELFVEILDQSCCCTPSTSTCFQIPIQFVPCS